MPVSRAAQNYLDDLSTQPAARQPATLGEIWDSEWKRGGLDTITGVGKVLQDARGELSTAIETASGKPIADYAAERRILLGGGVTFDQGVAALNALADTLPADQQDRVKEFRDVRRRAASTAQKTEREASEVAASTYGVSGVATAWAAAIARQTSDPINLAMMAATAPLGGPISGGAIKFIAGQAAGGAISQAVVEPYIEASRAELGLEAGFGRAAGNVLEAGIGGAVLGGAFVGLHRLFGAAARSYRGERPTEALDSLVPGEAPTQPAFAAAASEAPAPGTGHPNLAPEDFDALRLHAERDAVIADQTPRDVDPSVHAQVIKDAEAAVEDGRPVAGMVELPAKARPAPDTPAADAGPELPPARPIEPKGQSVEVKEPVDVVGDPALAQDADRRIAQRDAGDFQVHIEQSDGTIKAASAKSFLREIQNDAKAVKELIDCIGREPT